MFLSVVIPVFNAAPFLRECLESLRAQTFADWEALCVNDGSTDASAEILRAFAAKDPRFAVFSRENAGYGAAVNFGLARARGEYVAILEPDDALASPGAYAALADAAARSRADVVKGDYNFYRGKTGRRERAFALRGCPTGVLVNVIDCSRLLLIQPSVWSAFYRADFLRERAIRFLETPGASFQDISFSFKIFASASRVLLVDVPVVDYRQDNAASSLKSREKVFCVADEMHEVERWLGENPALRERFACEKWIVHYNAYSANLPRLAFRLQQPFLEVFRKEFSDAWARKAFPENFLSDARIKRRLPLLLGSPRRYLFIMRRRFVVSRIREAFRKIFCGLHFRVPAPKGGAK